MKKKLILETEGEAAMIYLLHSDCMRLTKRYNLKCIAKIISVGEEKENEKEQRNNTVATTSSD